MGGRREANAHVELTHWTCVAADVDGVVQEDRVGRRTVHLTLRIPKTGLGTPEEEKLASEIGAVLGGKVIPCAGGVFGNSFIIEVEREVQDG